VPFDGYPRRAAHNRLASRCCGVTPGGVDIARCRENTQRVRSNTSEERPDSEKPTSQLDDVLDRVELRDRFDMLLQEVRVALPGVQVLSAFLLTAPFSQRFDGLDRNGRAAYAIALTASMVSVVCLLGPTMLHRLGMRTARADRLRWSIRMVLAGLVSLAVALLSSLWGVARFVFGAPLAWALSLPVFALIMLAWVAVPATLRRSRTPQDQDGGG
jgi:hypothetical protein